MSERMLRIESPEYSKDVKEFEEIVKNTYRKYKLRNYGMKIKFNINKNKTPKIVLLCGNNEIETYNDITVNTLDTIINKIKEIFSETNCETNTEDISPINDNPLENSQYSSISENKEDYFDSGLNKKSDEKFNEKSDEKSNEKSDEKFRYKKYKTKYSQLLALLEK